MQTQTQNCRKLSESRLYLNFEISQGKEERKFNSFEF